MYSAPQPAQQGAGRAELTALADHIVAHGLVLEMLAGPLPGIYDPAGAAGRRWRRCRPRGR
ncbi:hypothetical protein ACIQH6_05040 [Micromonospora orduensis]|uniref:hypothetical protein n=1 Tax=Micromonospora orduensis TaxID=1420891 RepID=UPI00363C6641